MPKEREKNQKRERERRRERDRERGRERDSAVKKPTCLRNSMICTQMSCQIPQEFFHSCASELCKYGAATEPSTPQNENSPHRRLLGRFGALVEAGARISLSTRKEKLFSRKALLFRSPIVCTYL